MCRYMEGTHTRDRTTTFLVCEEKVLFNVPIVSWCSPGYTDVNGKITCMHIATPLLHIIITHLTTCQQPKSPYMIQYCRQRGMLLCTIMSHVLIQQFSVLTFLRFAFSKDQTIKPRCTELGTSIRYYTNTTQRYNIFEKIRTWLCQDTIQQIYKLNIKLL